MTVSAYPPLVPKDYHTEASRSLVPSVSMVGVVGQDDTVGTSFEDVWMGLGSLVYPTANESWEVVSSSNDDAAAGSGARTVTIIALDSTYAQLAPVTVTLNGMTPVALPNGAVYFRKNLFTVATVGTLGSAGVNAGNITLRVASAGATRGIISTGTNGSFCSHYTVPLGKSALWIQSSIFSPKNEDVTVRSRFQFGGVAAFGVGGSVNVYQNDLVFPFKAGLELPEKSEFLFQAKTVNVATITVTCVAEFEVRDI